MTTGTWMVGAYPGQNTPPDLFHARKGWNGGDGKTITGRVSRKQKWNAYVVQAVKFRATNKRNIGTRSTPNGAITVRTNHSWSVPPGNTTSYVFPDSLFNTYWTDNLELALQAKLIQKVKGHSYNMGVGLAEVDKLAGTITGSIKTIGFGVVDLLEGDFKGFARRFGTSPPSLKRTRRLQTLDISGRFLEMRYAVTPAIADAYEATKAFEAISNGPRQKVFETHKRIKTMVSVNTNYCAAQALLTVRRKYTYEMYEELAAWRQVGLGNPLSIVWERVPWSFVVDWFIPIGTYLEQIGQVPFMKGRWMRSDSIRYEFPNQKLAATHSVGGWYPAPPYPEAEWSSYYMRRIISFSPPKVPLPDLRVAGAVQGRRVGNAIALAHQLFARAANIPFDKGYGSKRSAPGVSAVKAIAYQLSRI